MTRLPRVIIESPFAGDRARNAAYLKRCVLDCLSRNESPYASHAFFTQFLDDDKPEDRQLGIDAGLEWSKAAEYIVVYTDFGISAGMEYAISRHEEAGRIVLYRTIGKESAYA